MAVVLVATLAGA